MEQRFDLIDILEILNEDVNNEFFPQDENFVVLTERLKDLKQEYEIKYYYKNKEQGFKFAYNIIFNESRANISLRACHETTIQLPEHNFKELSKEIVRNRFKNYGIVRDGIIVLKTLPVKITEVTFLKLINVGLINHKKQYNPNQKYILDFSKVPLSLKEKTTFIKIKDFVKEEYEIIHLKAIHAAYKHIVRDNVDLEGIAPMFSEEITKWLKQFGISENSFTPKYHEEGEKKQTEIDVLKIKINKLSNITSYKDFKKIQDKYFNGESLTIREGLMLIPIKEFATLKNITNNIENKDIIERFLNRKLEYYSSKLDSLKREHNIKRLILYSNQELIKKEIETKIKILVENQEIECNVEFTKKKVNV